MTYELEESEYLIDLQGHEHYVSRVKHNDVLECDACGRLNVDGYSCSECKFNIHEQCTFVFEGQEIGDHPSHDGHSLKLLTTGAPDHTDPKCHLCGNKTMRFLFHCSVCQLNLDIFCIADHILGPFYLNIPWHPHPVICFNFGIENMCDFCKENYGGKGYLCYRCKLGIHEKCVVELQEITQHPSHVRHPLKFLTSGAPNYTNPRCHICGEDTGNLLYHCDICKFNLDLSCGTKSPPLVSLSNMKVHEHTLTLMPRLISFVCDACGTKGDHSPYICVQCDFMTFHQKCARLPRVIHVNHHDHRVSFKYPLGPGDWRCGVCLEEIDWSYGAYICSICPCYAIHSLCATRDDVWDGEELDEVPEEVEDVEPFKRNDDNTITHFAHHYHNLMSFEKGCGESSWCSGCLCPIGTSCSLYKCPDSDCSFFLHETCANLPMKKRHFLSPQPLALSFDLLQRRHIGEEICEACHQIFCKGFIYSSELGENFDLLCSSITVPFIHESHDHHLLYLKLEHGNVKTCQGCGIDEKGVAIGCTKCNYFLDFRCATLPLTVMLPRYDDHPLTLCYGEEKASGKYWCDICERETNPKTWFYTCKDCGVTLHVFCVVGDVRYAKPGAMIKYYIELLSNNSSSRPLCHRCHCRCLGPFILRKRKQQYCSYYCYIITKSKKEYSKIKLRCPPWRSGHQSQVMELQNDQ
ncbi:putative chromatin regulator PHD family [Arabidopsis thaliana]|uniref:Phorbol-ester/DAG-type domain-containing protein n=1 Tax=Arabidopsis thaliana TaxID=3702 RepID=A0A178VHZ6_ARATH|nr:hypothetical protein AXX17_AT3G30020 [Arabidopsis thaliana]